MIALFLMRYHCCPRMVENIKLIFIYLFSGSIPYTHSQESTLMSGRVVILITPFSSKTSVCGRRDFGTQQGAGILGLMVSVFDNFWRYFFLKNAFAVISDTSHTPLQKPRSILAGSSNWLFQPRSSPLALCGNRRHLPP